MCMTIAVRAGQMLTEQRLGFLNFSAAAGIAPGMEFLPLMHADALRHIYDGSFGWLW